MSAIDDSDRLPALSLETPSGASATLRQLSLREEARSRTRQRILDGARVAVATFGLDATIDEVAATAGVSRRTVTRHFATHGELILATIIEMRHILDSQAPGPPSPDIPIQTWLIDATVKLHELYRHQIGRAFWDLYVDRGNTSSIVANRISGAMEVRRRYAEQIALAAWEKLGGTEDPPQWVMDAFSLQLSAFATNALPERSAVETGQVSAQILWSVLATALEEIGLEVPKS